MKPLGVGLIFVKELLPLLQAGDEAVSVIEVEPQTLWRLSRANGRDEYAPNYDLYQALAELPQPKLLHSVGVPVGSSRPLDREQAERLREFVSLFHPAWGSEHLSFNAFAAGDGWAAAGFLLPPRQCAESVAVAAARLHALREDLGIPIAFETGVNYLQPRAEEMPDGEFFAAVAHAADCGILLDLHNLWTNELNGRAPARDVLARLPLDRVWEVHLAGGMPLGRRWLDAHSDGVPEPVLDLAAEWIPKLPNLGGLVFEIMGEHVARLGLDGVARQVERMHALWMLRPDVRAIHLARPEHEVPAADSRSIGVAREWERALGGLVIGREPGEAPAGRLRADPGIPLFRQLVYDARAAFVSEGLRYTTTLLLCACGSASVRELLVEFMGTRPPELFVGAEADAFARFLRAKALPVPYLNEVLAFEHALVRASLYDESATVEFAHEPTALFECLDQGRLPDIAAHAGVSITVQVGHEAGVTP